MQWSVLSDAVVALLCENSGLDPDEPTPWDDPAGGGSVFEKKAPDVPLLRSHG